MAINLTHRLDLEEKIEYLAGRLKLTGRGRKTLTIERALDALEEKIESDLPNPEYIRMTLAKYMERGDEFRKDMYKAYPHLRGKDLSLAITDELYEKSGLPK